MKVTLLQTEIEWGNPTANIKQAESLMAGCPDSDLYVLPEMWSSGFATKPHDIAEEESRSVARQWMSSTAVRLRCAICGSLAVRLSDGTYRNRLYFFDGRKQSCQYYDKHHLFTYGGENIYYKPGETHTVVNYEGFRILLLTCYDLRFPVWSRYTDDLAYDMIVCVANWPDTRQNAFQILTRARAIENMCYLVAVNRVGADSYSHYRGCSCVVSPIGKTLARCLPDVSTTTSACIDIEYLRHKREKFRALEDRDRFLEELAL